jgi:Mpv17 / PMP22 family
MLFGYCVWPAAHVINFRYVPSDLRVLYINCVQVQSALPIVVVALLHTCASCRHSMQSMLMHHMCIIRSWPEVHVLPADAVEYSAVPDRDIQAAHRNYREGWRGPEGGHQCGARVKHRTTR